MARSCTFLSIADFKAETGFALGEQLNSMFSQFFMIPRQLSPFVAFVGILISKLFQGRPVIEKAIETFKPSQYISYSFQCLLSGDQSQAIAYILANYEAQISQELELLINSAITHLSESRKALFLKGQPLTASPHNWNLRLSALASLFEVCFLTLTDRRLYSLPVLKTQGVKFPFVSIMCWSNTSVIFINYPETLRLPDSVIALFQHAEMVERLLKKETINDQQYALIQEFGKELKELAGELQLLRPKLDPIAAQCLEQAQELQKNFGCLMCHSDVSVRLSCGHWMCSNCVFQGENWDPMNPVSCPECSATVNLGEIRSLLSDAGFNAKVRSLKDYSYTVCAQCGKMTQTEQSLALACQHDVCLPCLILAVQTKTTVCRLCQTFPNEEHIKFIDEKDMPCSMCDQQKKMVKFPKFRCADHWACLDCFNMTDVCPACSRELTDKEKETIKRCFFTCLICGRSHNRKEIFRGGVCGCRICQECFDQKLREELTITTCFVCKARFPESAILKHFLQIRNLAEDIDIPQLRAVAERRHVKRANCEICELADRGEKISLPCKHIMHTFCLTHRLLSQRIKNQSAACPVCNAAIDPSQVGDSGEVIYPKGRKCPKCKGDVEEVNETTMKCKANNENFCVKCEVENPENHKEEDCAVARLKLMTAKLRTLAPKDPSCLCTGERCDKCRHIAQCPSCKTPHLKKRSMKETTCTVCKAVFCHGCSVLMGPIRVHGDLWHRAQCPYSDRKTTPNVQEEITKTEKNDECPQCKGGDKCCAAPDDLAVRGQFP